MGPEDDVDSDEEQDDHCSDDDVRIDDVLLELVNKPSDMVEVWKLFWFRCLSYENFLGHFTCRKDIFLRSETYSLCPTGGRNRA